MGCFPVIFLISQQAVSIWLWLALWGERCVYCQSVFIAKQLDDEQKDLDLESWAVCCVLLYLPAWQRPRIVDQ